MKAEYGNLCDIKEIPDRQFFAGVACTWLQADPVEPQFLYWYRRRYCAASHDTATPSFISGQNARIVVFGVVEHEEYLEAVDLTSYVGTIPTWLASYFLV